MPRVEGGARVLSGAPTTFTIGLAVAAAVGFADAAAAAVSLADAAAPHTAAADAAVSHAAASPGAGHGCAAAGARAVPVVV